MKTPLKWTTAIALLAGLITGGAWGFAGVFDHASFAGGLVLSAVLCGGMVAVLAILDLKRLPGFVISVLVWVSVVTWGIHLAQERAVAEVARFVRNKPSLAARWGALPDDQIWPLFLVENGLDAKGPDPGSYMRLRAAQGIQVEGLGHRRREVRGFWLYTEWMYLVLVAGLGTIAPVFIIASLEDE